MKRRNADCGKLRRPLKRSKISESFYGSLFMYVKFLMVWLLVLLADFILEFRFEYLWPFWLLLRSVYDSFKYQGLAFSVFFVCIALTSDMICFLFIPIHWLFFAASTYVWVQFVWHTERGICLPTVSLWLLFVYIEASMRLRELKNLPFHLDLCRPFAAHCIGYPVVTLGFGFKSYVGYRMRQRKQREVSKENEFYMQLLKQALPQEQQNVPSYSDKAPASKVNEEIISNGITIPMSKKAPVMNTTLKPCDITKFTELDPREAKKQLLSSNSSLEKELEYMENQLHKRPSINDFVENADLDKDKSFKANGVVCRSSAAGRWNHNQTLNGKDNKENVSLNIQTTVKRTKNVSNKDSTTNNIGNQKDDLLVRLEGDIKRLKADLQASRQCELDLHSQINSLINGERTIKTELLQVQQLNESLQTKLHGLVTARQQDKQTISGLEKKLQEERKCRSLVEAQLATERKAKKTEEVMLGRSIASTQSTSLNSSRLECTESCKSRRRDLENDNKQFRRELKICEERLRQAEREAQTLRQYKDSHNETEVLMSALSAMQDKNAHLENSLSAETRLKLDLFSALGEAKRQLEIAQTLIIQKDKEIEDLKSKVAEVMAVMPPTTFPPVSLDSSIISSPPYSSKFVADDKISSSTLDPNASVYTPKALGSQ